MNAQDFLQTKLSRLKTPYDIDRPEYSDSLIEAIYSSLMSKKFRKYSASDELKKHIRNAIRLNVENNQPINITFLHGAYKLWRLDESPEVDWAELFSMMYYTDWVKSVCAIYEPGVWFDFFVDDYIISRLNNIPQDDVTAYIESYRAQIDFLKPYQPANLKMTITTVDSQFNSVDEFDKSLSVNLEKLAQEADGELPSLTDAQKSMVELNARPTADQLADPQWREKVYQLHNAYLATKAEAGYHKDRPEKILAFTQPLPSGTTISVGSTKSSVMKFWIGAGILIPRNGSYQEIILSPGQLEQLEYDWQEVNLGIPGKNFNKIRICHNE